MSEQVGAFIGGRQGRSHACSSQPPTDIFPQPDLTDDGLARPVLAGIVATICFLAAAILFSTLAACFVNKQRKRKLKRKKGGCLPPPPCSTWPSSKCSLLEETAHF